MTHTHPHTLAVSLMGISKTKWATILLLEAKMESCVNLSFVVAQSMWHIIRSNLPPLSDRGWHWLESVPLNSVIKLQFQYSAASKTLMNSVWS